MSDLQVYVQKTFITFLFQVIKAIHNKHTIAIDYKSRGVYRKGHLGQYLSIKILLLYTVITLS